MAIAFPLARSLFADRLKIAAFRWQLQPFVESSGTALGQVIANEIAPRRWRAEVELARMPHVEAADIQALIDALGPSGTFYLHNPGQLGPRDDRDGAVIAGHSVGVNAVGADNKSLRLAGLPAGYRLRRGDMLHFDYGSSAHPAGAASHRRGCHRQRCRNQQLLRGAAVPEGGDHDRAHRHPGPRRCPDDARARLVRPGHRRPGLDERHGLQGDRGPLMRAVDSAAQALRGERAGLAERIMVWIAARNRLSGDIEALGLWTGEDSETITVTDLWTGAPATRVFHGAGSLLGISAVQHEAGLSVRPVRLTLSALERAGDRGGAALRPARRPGADLAAHALARHRPPRRRAGALVQGLLQQGADPAPRAGRRGDPGDGGGVDRRAC